MKHRRHKWWFHRRKQWACIGILVARVRHRRFLDEAWRLWNATSLCDEPFDGINDGRKVARVSKKFYSRKNVVTDWAGLLAVRENLTCPKFSQERKDASGTLISRFFLCLIANPPCIS